jgi:hypothetical protein
VSIDPLPQKEIRAWLQRVWADSVHLAPSLPVDNVHNKVLRLADVARFVDVDPKRFADHRLDPPRTPMSDELQRRLTTFIYGWNTGHLVKRRVGDRWLVRWHDSTLAPVAASTGAAPPARLTRALELNVDWMAGKLKVGE